MALSRIFLFSSILFIYGCKKSITVEYQISGETNSFDYDTIALVFEDGFSMNKVRLEYCNNEIFNSEISTDPSSNLASDFIGVIQCSPSNKALLKIDHYTPVEINLNFKYRTHVIQLKNNTIKMKLTNRTLLYD